MAKRLPVLVVLAFSALLCFPSTGHAGDAFLKLGLTLSDVGGFTDRWFVSFGSDWGFNESGHLGLEVQTAYRSNTQIGPAQVDSVPINLFLNGKWKGNTDTVRPFAGVGFGMMSAYVSSDLGGSSSSEWIKDGGLQLMGGIELHDKWVLELLGQRVFADGASFTWSFLAGVTW